MQNDSGCEYLAVSLESGWRGVRDWVAEGWLRGGSEESDGRNKLKPQGGEEKRRKKGGDEGMRATTADSTIRLAVLDANSNGDGQ